MTTKLPIVLCELAGGSSWQFWCPFCHDYHVHGGGNDGTELGHRSAHCHVPFPGNRLRPQIQAPRAQKEGARLTQFHSRIIRAKRQCAIE